jgi:hypothetical protein
MVSSLCPVTVSEPPPIEQLPMHPSINHTSKKSAPSTDNGICTQDNDKPARACQSTQSQQHLPVAKQDPKISRKSKLQAPTASPTTKTANQSYIDPAKHHYQPLPTPTKTAPRPPENASSNARINIASESSGALSPANHISAAPLRTGPTVPQQT